jgi:hypothetical protein
MDEVKGFANEVAEKANDFIGEHAEAVGGVVYMLTLVGCCIIGWRLQKAANRDLARQIRKELWH